MNTELDEVTRWMVKAADEKKAEDFLILDLANKGLFAERFIIVTALSRVHLKAVAEEVRKTLKEHTDYPVYAEGFDSPGWILFECQGVVLHIFNRETREYYALESLWGDAPRLEVERFLIPPVG